MPLELVTDAPNREEFTPLSEHQAETPTTFFGARPVLHHHSTGAKLAIRKSEYDESEELSQLPALAPAEGELEEVSIEVDVWVTSQFVTLYSTTALKGVKIDFPTIALHALGTQDGQTAVYLQLDLHDRERANDDDDIQTMSLHIIPKTTSSDTANGHSGDTVNGDSRPPSSEAQALFEALSACADLNPDPEDQDEEGEDGEGMMQMPEPGAGGWITSENMHEFMDADGNWTGPQIQVLGAGAGTVRAREEDGAEEAGEGAADGEETKWQRTG